MNSRNALIKMHRFQVDEMRRNLAGLEAMLSDFRKKEEELEVQVRYEKERAGVSDVAQFAYPSFARTVLDRRENLSESVRALNLQVDEAKRDLTDAFRELKRIELLEESNQQRDKKTREKKEQTHLDEVASSGHQRTNGRSADNLG